MSSTAMASSNASGRSNGSGNTTIAAGIAAVRELNNCSPSGGTQRQFDENGLVLPRKLANPNVQSRPKKELHREMLWRMKFGPADDARNCELTKAYNQFASRQRLKEQDATPSFEKMLEEQKQRLHSIQQQQSHQSTSPSSLLHSNDSSLGQTVETMIDKNNDELARVFLKVRSKSSKSNSSTTVTAAKIS